MADTDKLRISGLVVAFLAFIMHLIMVSLGYTSLDWGPIMVGGIFFIRLSSKYQSLRAITK